jgi:hypothetical protein
MTTQVEVVKKIDARRHAQVADEFSRWQKANPEMSLKRQIQVFDTMCDVKLMICQP